MVDELAGKHGDEHDADEVSGARGQHANQAVDRTSSQIYWLYGRGWDVLDGLDAHPAFQISGRFCYSLGKTWRVPWRGK
jgi:hypothetical protein